LQNSSCLILLFLFSSLALFFILIF
jgi:hypothetical protein